MQNAFLYIADNEIGLLNLVDVDAVAVTGATVTASVFSNTPLALGSSLAATREVQTLIPDIIATGGTFLLGYHGVWTSAIAYNASLATILAALEALSNLIPGDVVVGGQLLSAAGFATGMTFTFARTFGEAFQLDFDFTSITGPTQNGSTLTQTTAGVSEGVAIDLSGGKVGIPIVGGTNGIADIYTSGFVQITGTRNYDGQYAYDPLLSTKTRIAITATFVYEEFTGLELVYIGKGLSTVAMDVALTHDTGGNYYGFLPADTIGVRPNESVCVLIKAAIGGLTQFFRCKPQVKYSGE
jgi:hypothetical protein